jgi:hypothetical protein
MVRHTVYELMVHLYQLVEELEKLIKPFTEEEVVKRHKAVLGF